MNIIAKINRTVAENKIGVVLDMQVGIGKQAELSVLIDTSEESVLNARFTKCNGEYGQEFGVYVSSVDAQPPEALIEDEGASAHIQFATVFASVRMVDDGVIVDIYDLDEENESVLNSCFAEYHDLLNVAAECA
jgi:hypothetical protein